MAKQEKNKAPNKKFVSKNLKKTTITSTEKQFWGLEEFLDKNQLQVMLGFLFLSLIFSFFLFDIKISEGGDDSGYIQRAWYFLTRHEFPFYQGPLYPLVLAIPLSIFGINLFVLKLCSVIFALGSLWFTYLAFRKRIPYIVLFSLICFLAVNSYIQYYASQTYTESFFLFLQAFALYFVMKMIDSMDAESANPAEKKINYKGFLWIGLCFTLLSLSKSIAIVCIIPVILFFLFYRNYKYALFTFLSFAVCKAAVELGIRALYEGGSGQLQQILLKDLYKPELGYEDFSGIMTRFYSNAQHFLSVSVYKIFHFREAIALQPIGFLTFITALGLILFAAFSYKRNRYIFFAGLYLLVLSSGIFGGIQANNKQDRLMLIVIPFIFIVLFYGLYKMTNKSSVMRFYFFCFLVAFLGINLFNSIAGSAKHFSVLQKNMKGDSYYGYTEDWVNFLKMSAYCADSLPPESFVASRKASMSFIYGKGKEFYGVYMVFSNDPDSTLAKFKQEKVTHVILASLRQNPRFNNGQVINTLQRLLYPIAQKYPQKLSLVKQIGESEPAYLYKLNY